MERAAREALAEARPGSDYELYLVLVDDRPGVDGGPRPVHGRSGEASACT